MGDGRVGVSCGYGGLAFDVKGVVGALTDSDEVDVHGENGAWKMIRYNIWAILCLADSKLFLPDGCVHIGRGYKYAIMRGFGYEGTVSRKC